MDYQLLDLESVLRKIGRGVVYYAHDGTGPNDVGDPVKWDAASELQLAHLGDTEGDIVLEPNGSVANLTLPEISGGAIHEATYVGENPQLQVPLYLADPDLLPILSPTGQASAGHFRVRDVSERTVVVFPEDLFRDTDESYKQLAYTSGGGWTLGGSSLDAAHQTLMELSVWIWRCYVERPTRSFMGGHGDDGKNIATVNINAMMHPSLPDGNRLYTLGDPALASTAIDITGGS